MQFHIDVKGFYFPGGKRQCSSVTVLHEKKNSYLPCRTGGLAELAEWHGNKRNQYKFQYNIVHKPKAFDLNAASRKINKPLCIWLKSCK